jgi:hypothetical protein
VYEENDPVDRALTSLRSEQWTAGSHNNELEEKLMREFHTNRQPTGLRKHRTLVATLAVVLVSASAMGFTAAGGVEAVKTLLVKVKIIGPDGTVYDGTLEPVELEGDVATMTLDTAEGDQATVTIQRVEAGDLVDDEEFAPGEEMTMLSVSLEGVLAGEAPPDGEATVEITALAAGEGPVDQADILEQIDLAEMVVPWKDADGEPRELYIVRTGGEERPVGFELFSSRLLDDGETVYDAIGHICGSLSEGTEIDAVEVDEYGAVTMTLLTEDGEEKTVTLNKAGDPASSRVHVILEGEEGDMATEMHKLTKRER